MENPVCDIHMHLIPHADDGASGMEEALLMLYQAHRQGVRQIFATPHSYAFDRDPSGESDSFSALQAMAARFFPDVQIFPGCEVLCDPFSMDATLEALACGKYPSLNGTKFVLTEFSPWGTAEGAVCCVDALRNAGWIPVIAHMERYSFFQGHWDWVRHFREIGCMIQINAFSLAEETNPAICSLARELVAEQLADFLGSDAHNTSHRPPRCESGVRWITENCGETYARRLLRENAYSLLIGKEGSS